MSEIANFDVDSIENYLIEDDEKRSLRVLRVARERWRARYHVRRRDHHCWFVALVESGEGWFRNQDQEFEALLPGSVLCYGPGAPHEVRAAPRGLQCLVLNLAGEGVAAVLRARIGATHTCLVPAISGQAALQWQDLLRQCRHGGALLGEIAAHQVALLLLLLQRGRLAQRAASDPALATYVAARAHMDRDYADLTTVSAVAAAVHVSAAHLSRLFRRFDAGGAKRYLLERQLQAACHHLLDSDAGLAVVAQRSGFADADSLSRAFRRRFACSPGRWRHVETQTAGDLA
ncbi:MAG: helix-turn-helix domain-containing protein [Planctomycetota bacterium]|jgi:AraC-like DNA-binding protein|nr:helix-turn-helix domain-containing protein [Planctomycetota bacterium]